MKALYLFFVVVVSQAVGWQGHATPLQLGATTTGQLAQPGEVAQYTFTGSSGQRLIYDALDSDQLSMNARFIGPGGNVIWERNSRTDVEPFTLVDAGTYTLVIDGNGATVGPFHFRLVDLSAQPVFNFDTVLTKTLDPGTLTDVYQFQGTAGQHLYFDGLGANQGAVWYLYAPNNQNLGGAGIGGDFEVVLPQTGVYALVLYGTSPTPVIYSCQVVTGSAATTPLTVGTTVSGTIAKPGDQHLYTFTGTVGQRIYYDAFHRQFEQVNIRLISPSGGIVWDWTNHSNDTGPSSLLESGVYTLLIDGAGATTAAYQFRILDLATAATLNLAAPTSGQLNPASATDAYQFAGKAGQRINFASISASGNQASWRLIGPANQALLNSGITANLGDALLPAAGTYFLLVEGAAESLTPLSYQFIATDHSDPPVAVSGLGTTRSGTIAAGQEDTLSFNAPAGLWVYFDSMDRTAVSLLADLRDPGGKTLVTVGASQDAGPYVLPVSGAYTFVMHGNSAAATGTFSYRLLDLSNGAAALTYGAIMHDSLDPAYRTDVYAFDATAGQRLVYDALETDFNSVSARLVGPDGQIRYLNGNADSDIGPFTIAVAGRHYLFFESNMATPVTYTGRFLNVSGAPEAQPGAPATASIDPGIGIVAYRVSLQSGQRFYVHSMSAVNTGSWLLYGPNNEGLSSAALTGDMEIVAAQTGTYVLLLSGNAAAPFTEAFQLYKPNSGNQGSDLQITSISTAGGANTLVWNATAGKVYRVQFKADLGQPGWTDLPGDVTATGTSASKADTSLGGQRLRFYQVLMLAQ